MYEIHKFCNGRKIPKKLEDAFTAYCKASISEYYDFSSKGRTVTGILMDLKPHEVETLWNGFVKDLRDAILSTEKQLPKSE